MIAFVPYTEQRRHDYARWLASLTKAELLEYTESKMMPVRYMLNQWRTARKMQRTAKSKAEDA